MPFLAVAAYMGLAEAVDCPLHLGITDIRLGPSLPAFVTPNVLGFLVQNFNIAPITTAEADLKQILG